VSLSVVGDDTKGVLYLVWPAANPDAVLESGEKRPPDEPSPVKTSPDLAVDLAVDLADDPDGPGKTAPPPDVPVSRKLFRGKVEDLPAYSRNLLKIKVPVIAALASKKQSVGEIIKLGPGAILQFDKSCEEMLNLEVGNQPVAEGEAVKVGEKFGLRITSIVLPDERFIAVTGTRKK